ncbi:MAG: hypothetical protein L0206_01100, partial [Actinobacteria bacterium]|nr:hypothetical protein [Actinomycetota bacterium]
GPGQGVITRIAVRSDGVVFFTQTSFLTGTTGVWRFDPDTGERSELVALGPAAARLAVDGADSLVVSVAAGRAPGSQPELRWIDSETGDTTRALLLPRTLIGISDVALDQEGRVLLSSSRSGVMRVDPRTGEVETISSARGLAMAIEADGSVLLAQCCLVPIPRPGPYVEPDLVGSLSPFPVPRSELGLLPEPYRLSRIDPDTGEAGIVSMGNLLGRPSGIDVEADGGIVVSSEPLLFGDSGNVVRVDPDDGTQTLVVGDLPAASAIAVVPPAVAIDVLSSRITMGPRGRRTLFVVLFGSDLVDLEDVDVARLAFGPDGAAPVGSRVVRRGRDAFPDLLLFFRAEESGLVPGDLEACLVGTVGVFDFEACDGVVVRETRAPNARGRGLDGRESQRPLHQGHSR